MKTGTKRTLQGTVGAGAAAILLSIVPKFEGVILRGYKDPIGIVTACAGQTNTGVLGRPYTPKNAPRCWIRIWSNMRKVCWPARPVSPGTQTRLPPP